MVDLGEKRTNSPIGYGEKKKEHRRKKTKGERWSGARKPRISEGSFFWRDARPKEEIAGAIRARGRGDMATGEITFFASKQNIKNCRGFWRKKFRGVEKRATCRAGGQGRDGEGDGSPEREGGFALDRF